MLTLGTKELILNATQLGRIKVYKPGATAADPDVLLTNASTLINKKLAHRLDIEGFGSFNLTKVKANTLRGSVERAQDPNKAVFTTIADKLGYIANTASATTLVFEIGVSSPRNSSIVASQFVQHVGAYNVEVVIPANSTLKAVFDIIKAAFEARKKLWQFDDTQFELTVGGTTTATATLSITSPDNFMDIEYIKFLASTEGNVPSKLFPVNTVKRDNAVAVNYTMASGGIGTGKWLSETVKFEGAEIVNPYGMRSGEYPVLDGKYTTFTFEFESSNFKDDNTSFNFDGRHDRVHQATIYVQEPNLVGGGTAIPVSSALHLLLAMFADVDVKYTSGGVRTATTGDAAVTAMIA